MATLVSRADPTGEAVLKLLQGSGGTGSYNVLHSVRIPLALTSTANAAANFINPEAGTVAARAYWVFITAGTGTFDAGRSSDGTGSSSDMILAGTLAVGIVSRPGDLGTAAGTTGSAGTVGTRTEWWLLGPGGSGTNNSIVMKHSDTPTSTMAGAMVVEYFLVT